ncbi:MAG: putative dsRNA-binding protein [Cytophagales bacterium]|nr:putative dsRNA-binding protein [Cytophagales bacterium]
MKGFFKAILPFSPGNVSLYFFLLGQLKRPFFRFALYKEALSPFSRKPQKDSPSNNQRLEFLGDAVIGLSIAEYLYQKYPYSGEGKMSEIRSKMVNEDILAKLCQYLGLPIQSAIRAKRLQIALLADTMESFLGAIHLDKGYLFAKKYILNVISQAFNLSEIAQKEMNYKGRLLEWGQRKKQHLFFDSQRNKKAKPQQHTIWIYIGNEWASAGHGRTKKKAEQEASKKAIEQLNIS